MPSVREGFYYYYGATDAAAGVPWSPENHSHPFTYTYMPIPPVNSQPLPTPPPHTTPPRVLEPEVHLGPASPYYRRQPHEPTCPQASWTPPPLTVPCPVHTSGTAHVPVYPVEQPARSIHHGPYNTTAHSTPVYAGGVSNATRDANNDRCFRGSSATGATTTSTPRVVVMREEPGTRDITPSPPPPPMQQRQPQEYVSRRASAAVPYLPALDGDQQFWVQELDGSYELKTAGQIRDTCQPGSWKTGLSGFPYFVRERRETAF